MMAEAAFPRFDKLLRGLLKSINKKLGSDA
jgi:hypothetical protein